MTMAACGIGWCRSRETFEMPVLGFNSSTRPTFVPRNSFLSGKRNSRVKCSFSREGTTPMDIDEGASVAPSDTSVEDDALGHVMKFKMSDFDISDQISIGLGGRTDELVFEAMVKNVHSPLYKSRVVLRRLSSIQAQRRGKRAIEVLKKLARRRLMYHSYSMQVHGYVEPSTSADYGSFTLVHGYHGSFSLRHWLQQSDWLPTLEATLALDEEAVRRVGDDTVGGPAVSRKLRIIRVLMRDLLIGVNYLHSHGLAHTELKLENVHICPVDKHIKVGILGNASDFYEDKPNISSMDGNTERRQMMIGFDMRCVGYIMAKMVLRELMEPSVFGKLKSFLHQGNDPSCLREFLLRTFGRNSSSGNPGLQILDRNWGAGWNLLALLLAPKPSERISCLDALRHPFLCGPRWRVGPSMDIIRWGLGSTAVRITEEYIYGLQQRNRLAHFIELLEMLNPHSKPKKWIPLVPGKWRLLYSTGRHIGLTLRQPPLRVLIGDVHLTVNTTTQSNRTFSFTSDISFTVLTGKDWPSNKSGSPGKLRVNSPFKLTAGRRLYLKDEKNFLPLSPSNTHDAVIKKLSGKKWRKILPFKKLPSSLSVARLVCGGEVEVTMNLEGVLGKDVEAAQKVLGEVRTQVPPEMFDVSKIVCGTYIDSRLMVVRGVNGSALLFTRSAEEGNRR